MLDDVSSVDYCWWCPDCGLPRGVCDCESRPTTHEADQPYGWVDGEPDFTLDDLEWEELFG